MLGLKNRESLTDIVADEFENMVSQFRALFLTEHNEDGSHRASPEVTNFVPAGAIMPYAGSTAPSNWLICDGSQQSRVVKKRLFDVLGTTYGIGDGSTTFNIPDLRGRFALGKAAAGTGSVLGSTGGTIDHTHTGGAHTHTISGTSAATTPTVSGSTAGATASISGSTANESSHTHSYSGTVAPSDDATLGVDAGFTNSVNVSNHDHTYSGTTGGGSAHSHGVGSLSVDSHSHGTGTLAVSSHTHAAGTLTADSGGGGGTTGTANPPYLSILYIIKD